MISAISNFLFIYYLIVNSTYLVLLIAAFFSIREQNKIKPLMDSLRDQFSSFGPAISILAPAYNEQETIVNSVKSFLMLNYPSFEVVVINDGSKDKTLVSLIEAFSLEENPLIYTPTLSKTKIRKIYRSKLHPNLFVIDKENGGKADALNVGIDFAQNDLFCAVDSDSILEEDALLKVSLPFLKNPGETIASGGTVRIANGSQVHLGRIEKVALKHNFLVLMQIVEYTRAFLCGRIGWNVFNATLVISGAFGLFSKQAVLEVGGYEATSIGEDMELVVRLHRHFRMKKQKYSIVFIPDPVCWTEAPETFSALRSQRDRWQRGLADTLLSNRAILFNPKYGTLGLIAFPYFFAAELFGPAVEIFSLCFIGYLEYMKILDVNFLAMLFAVAVLYSTFLSIAAFFIEEVYFCKYSKISQFLVLFLVCLNESFGYRQITSFWRLRGMFRYIRGNRSWGHLQRVGFSTSPQSIINSYPRRK